MTAQAGETEAFGDHALARERRIAMDQQRHHGRAIIRRAALLILFCAHLAEHHRIDDLEMRRISGERQVDVVVVERAVARRAEVILHVARAFHVIRRERAALELMEERPVRLAHHLRQHVEAAAMGHAEHDLLARRDFRRA